MFIIPLLVLLSFGLVVKLIGLLGLAYTKKEGLGKIYKITSYLTIAFGTLIFIGGIIAAILFSTCHNSGCHKGKSKCKTEVRSHCGGGACEKSSHKKSSCESACDHHGKKVIKKTIITEGEDGDEEEVNVEVKVIKD